MEYSVESKVKTVKKLYASFLSGIMLLSSLCVGAHAANAPLQSPAATNQSSIQEETGFTPTADSTWGDVLRALSPEEFNNLPETIQRQYDNTPLNSPNSDASLNRTSSLRGSQPIASLLSMYLATTGKAASIDYFVIINAYKLVCPYMAVSAVLYDAETNKYVDSNVNADTNVSFCDMDETFDGLKRSHKYRIEAASSVTPPVNYTGTSVLTRQQTLYTK